MTPTAKVKTCTTVAEACNALEAIAPVQLAQDWDNVGLLAGDPAARISRILLTIDLTPEVCEEAVRGRVDLIVSYHPPIFRPVNRLVAGGMGTEGVVLRCLAAGMAIYSPHTALDAADGGTNDVLAAACGVHSTEPIEYVPAPGKHECKLVTFVPAEQLDRVADALFAAGAGHIGDYSHCSYRLRGQGTFWGGEGTNPQVGQRGRLELVDEVRLEVVVPKRDLEQVVAALRNTHPYEEPAFDVYALIPPPVRGIGRIGFLAEPVPLAKLARRLKRSTPATTVQMVGSPDQVIERVIVVVGAAGSLPLKASLGAKDAVITGEMRHHDALTLRRCGTNAVLLGHWASEQPVLKPLAERLRNHLAGVDIAVSEADRDPFAAL